MTQQCEQSISVYPSPKISDVAIVEANKATLSIHQFLENGNETFVIDNEVIYNISHHILKAQQSKYAQLNCVISLVKSIYSGVAVSLQFSGELNGCKFSCISKITFFFSIHIVLVMQNTLKYQCKKRQNLLANVTPENGKYLAQSCALGYRGSIARLTEELGWHG